MWNFMNFYPSGLFFSFMFVPFLILILVVVLIVKLILPKNSSENRNGDSKALEILKERLAKGEISEDEYISKREILKK